jgi:hypothetical protein
MSRHHHQNRIDRSLRKPQWGIRIVTLLILAAGAAVVLYAFTRAESRRERALSGLEVGDTSQLIVERLGEPPFACSTGQLTHLEGQFPSGWPAAARAGAIERLRVETAERWVYPMREAHVNPCALPRNASEFGIGHDGRVRWFVPLTERHPIRLPETYAPGTMLNDTL